MFGRTKEAIDTDQAPTSAAGDHDLTVDAFFGDEEAAAEATRTEHLHHRVSQMEQQLNSQFTSMAAYAQIAQEQVEMARAEAKTATERTERRVTELIDRERRDRIEAVSGRPPGDVTSGWSTTDTARLDALELTVSEIRHGLNECLARQKALADAITALFEPKTATALAPQAGDGPISGLSLV